MADKKKSAILGVLSIVLLVVVGRQLGGNAEPAPAVAESLIPSAEPAQPTPVAALSMRPEPQQIAAATPNAESTPEIPTNEDLARWLRSGRDGSAVCVDDMPKSMTRDLFRAPSWSKFPVVVTNNTVETDGDAGRANLGSFWSKLGGGIVSYQSFRRQETEEIDKEIAELVLQSTMTGPKALAHISGHLVRVGDKLRGFSVVRIEDRQVTLSRAGVQRILAMP